MTSNSMAIIGHGLIGFTRSRPLKSLKSQEMRTFRATLVTLTRCARRSSYRLLDRRFDLRDRERLAGHFVERPGVDQELVAKQGLELSAVHLGHEDMIIALE